MRILRTGLVFSLLAFLLVSCQSIVNDSSYVPAVSVTGEGEARADADVASFVIRAEAVRDSADEARADVSLLINSAVDILISEFGVERDDLKTGYISISPYYEWNEGKRELKGQSANESIDVSLSDISMAGLAYERLSSINGLSVSSMTIDKKDKTELMREARIKAVENARDKAASYAEALNLRIGDVISISDGTEGSPRYLSGYSNAMMLKAEAASDSSSTEYYAGDVVVRDSVSVVFSLI